MKKIIWIGSILLLSSKLVSAQSQVRPVQAVNPVVPGTAIIPQQQGSTNNNGVLINNPNGTPINMNNKDLNSTQPGDNQPGNRVVTPPTQNPVIIDNTNPVNPPVIYTAPVQNPQVPATPASNQQIIQR